jgi:hypothetical protein
MDEMNYLIKKKEYIKAGKIDKKDAVPKKDGIFKKEIITNEQVYNLMLSYKADIEDIKNVLKKINKKLSLLEAVE